MTYQHLLQARLIEPYRVAKSEIEALLEVARRDVKTAQELVNIDLDWALIVAYNAALQAGMAFMYSRGFRPQGPDRHKVVIRFLQATLSPTFKPMLNRLDRIRKKRHQAIYRMAGTISENEARGTIQFADKFVAQLTSLIEL